MTDEELKLLQLNGLTEADLYKKKEESNADELADIRRALEALLSGRTE